LRRAAKTYLFFGLAPLLPGVAKIEDTEATAPAPFAAADFFGFLISRFDRTWPLAMSVSQYFAQL
jgi:hypothetical protein